MKTRVISTKPKFKSFSWTSVQRVNRIFVIAFEDDAQRTGRKRYLPNIEIKDYNVMIDGKNLFDQPVKNDKITWKH